MSTIITLVDILTFIEDDIKTFKKAERSLKAKNISSIDVDTDLKMIRAKVAASMKRLLYDVEVCIYILFIEFCFVVKTLMLALITNYCIILILMLILG